MAPTRGRRTCAAGASEAAVDAEAWDARYAGSELVWSAGPNRFVEEACADLPAGRALDLAAGEGRNAIWLARRGWQVTALDFSAVALDKGRRLAGDTPVTWRRADATTFEPAPVHDLVVVAYLQLPADQRRAAVRRAAASLAPGGTLFLVAHDSSNLLEGTGGPQDPAVLYTAEDVVADLTGSDDTDSRDGEQLVPTLEIERAERVARAVAASDEHGGAAERTAYDCLVRSRRRT